MAEVIHACLFVTKGATARRTERVGVCAEGLTSSVDDPHSPRDRTPTSLLLGVYCKLAETIHMGKSLKELLSTHIFLHVLPQQS